MNGGGECEEECEGKEMENVVVVVVVAAAHV